MGTLTHIFREVVGVGSVEVAAEGIFVAGAAVIDPFHGSHFGLSQQETHRCS